MDIYRTPHSKICAECERDDVDLLNISLSEDSSYYICEACVQENLDNPEYYSCSC